MGKQLDQEAFYPELAFGGYTRQSGSVEFFSRIAALITPDDTVLDLGAGRGAQVSTDISPYGRFLKTLKGRVAKLHGCDMDPVVLENPFMDETRVIPASGKLPYDDNSFDLIYSSWVIEHVEHPQIFVPELLRVLKPGGYFCAITTNSLGYIAIGSRVVKSSLHNSVLKLAQPERDAHDTFPAFYRMNTKGALRKLFSPHGKLAVYAMSSEPSYHFNNQIFFAFMLGVHKMLPSVLHTTLFVYFRKSPEPGA